MAKYHYERLRGESASHLMLETSRAYSHALSILVFESGGLALPDGRLDIEQICHGIESRLHLAPRFRQRLKWVPFEDFPVWVDDREFNLDYHVRHTALPSPGSRPILQKLAGRLMSSRLGRSRPMWEIWVVEGLEQDRFALISKVHSCMIESDSASDLIAELLSSDPDDTYADPPAFEPRPFPSGLELARDEFIEKARLPLRAFNEFRTFAARATNMRAEVLRRFGAAAKLFGYSVVPPRATPINGRLGPHRRIETLVLPLERVTAIHRDFECSVLDVVLALVCRGLRTFLKQNLVHPASLDLRVSIPVQADSSSGHDELHDWIIELPVWQDDPAATIEIIRERTRAANETDPALGAESLFSVAHWTGSRTLTLAARTLASHTPSNTSVASIPGALGSLYFKGARLVEAYGATPLRGEQALSIAVTSYDGRLCVALNADYDLVPRLDHVSKALIRALDEFSELGRRKRTGSRTRRARKDAV